MTKEIRKKVLYFVIISMFCFSNLTPAFAQANLGIEVDSGINGSVKELYTRLQKYEDSKRKEKEALESILKKEGQSNLAPDKKNGSNAATDIKNILSLYDKRVDIDRLACELDKLLINESSKSSEPAIMMLMNKYDRKIVVDEFVKVLVERTERDDEKTLSATVLNLAMDYKKKYGMNEVTAKMETLLKKGSKIIQVIDAKSIQDGRGLETAVNNLVKKYGNRKNYEPLFLDTTRLISEDTPHLADPDYQSLLTQYAKDDVVKAVVKVLAKNFKSSLGKRTTPSYERLVSEYKKKYGNDENIIKLIANEKSNDSKVSLTEEMTNRFIVKYKNDKGKKEISSAIKDKLVSLIDISTIENKKIELLTTKTMIKYSDLMKDLKSKKMDTNIEYIQPDYPVKLSSNNTYFNKQQGKNKTDIATASVSQAVYQSVYREDISLKKDAVINNTSSKSKGKEIIVAVINDGSDIKDEELAQSTSVKNGEKPENGINEEIIAAIKENFKGVAGEAPGVKILPLKVFNNGTAYTSDVIKALESAEKMGAKAIIYSWEKSENNPALRDAMEESSMLFVSAAGNTDTNIDKNQKALSTVNNTVKPQLASISANTTSPATMAVYNTALQSTAGSSLYSQPQPVISAGSNHSLMIKDGAVWAWGQNWSGQLGDGTKLDRSSPVQVTGLTGLVAVSAGSSHSIALKNDGTVWAWGSNYYGELGDGTKIAKSSPMQVTGLTGVVAVSAGNGHSIALKNDGTVWSWGNNGSGQLGDGTKLDRSSPVQVSGLTGVVAVSAGASHSIAIKNDGTIWSWGNNSNGQLGDGTRIDRSSPGQIPSLTGMIAISAGDSHSIALGNDGTVWAWGANWYGQLGDGTRITRNSPVQANGLGSISLISAGAVFSLALDKNGKVWSWGDNYNYQLGTGEVINRNTYNDGKVANLSGVSKIAAGSHTGLAIKNGEVWEWGCEWNEDYGDALNDSIGGIKGIPEKVSGLTGIIDIASGDGHSLALKADGTVWAWGFNAYGQLGDGSNIDSITPVQVTGLNNIITVKAGNCFSVALKNDGTVWTWGNNAFGQLGDGTNIDRATPVKVQGLTNVEMIAVGSLHCLAASNYEEKLWAWGMNTSGQLGDGTLTNRNLPIPVSIYGVKYGLYDNVIDDLSAGSTNSLILLNNYQESREYLYTCGTNNEGVLGIGDTNPVTITSPEMIESGFMTISSNYYQAFSSLYNDSNKSFNIKAWGSNYSSQLGLGNTTNVVYSPQILSNTYNTLPAVGKNHSLMLLKDGTIYSWGDNTYGQLGDGRSIYRQAPGLVVGQSISEGKNIELAITAKDMQSFSGKTFVVIYNKDQLDVIDLCAATSATELTAGSIGGTNITITEYNPSAGSIKFTVNTVVPQGKTWSGIVNTILFKPKVSRNLIQNIKVTYSK